MNMKFAYGELIVAILFALAAYVCGIVGKDAKKGRWLTSFCAVAVAYLAAVEAGYRFLNLPERPPAPVLVYLIGAFLVTFFGGLILGGLSWLLGRGSYYTCRTVWGAILLAYRASQKAKATDPE